MRRRAHALALNYPMSGPSNELAHTERGALFGIRGGRRARAERGDRRELGEHEGGINRA